LFVVSRILKYVGVRGALFFLPLTTSARATLNARGLSGKAVPHETHQNRRHSSTGEQKLYTAAEAVRELAELVDTGEASATENLLRVLSEQFSEGLSDVSFPFED
jgi:hypothetical protein